LRGFSCLQRICFANSLATPMVETPCVSSQSQKALAFCKPALQTYRWYVCLTLRRRRNWFKGTWKGILFILCKFRCVHRICFTN